MHLKEGTAPGFGDDYGTDHAVWEQPNNELAKNSPAGLIPHINIDYGHAKNLAVRSRSLKTNSSVISL